MRLGALLIIAVVLAVSGCGDEGTGSLPSEGTILEYSRAGGIAFSIYEVAIDADGTGIARFGSDPRDLSEREFELSGSQVSKLRSILEENPISSFPDRGDTVCADCFEYTYAYGGEEYTTDDASEPVEGLAELSGFLAELPLPEDQPNSG